MLLQLLLLFSPAVCMGGGSNGGFIVLPRLEFVPRLCECVAHLRVAGEKHGVPLCRGEQSLLQGTGIQQTQMVQHVPPIEVGNQ